MQDELIVLESMQSAYDFIAEEGVIKYIKDRIEINNNRTKEQIRKLQELRDRKKTTTQDEDEDETTPNTMVSGKEFQDKYIPQFIKAREALHGAIVSIKRDEKAAKAVKCFNMTNDNVKSISSYDTYTTKLKNNTNTHIIINAVEFDINKGGNGRQLIDDKEWQAANNYIIATIKKAFADNKNKYPDLDLMFDTDWDEGYFTLKLENVNISK